MKRTRDLEIISGLVNADGSMYNPGGDYDEFSVIPVSAGYWSLQFFPEVFRPIACVVTIAADALSFAAAVPVLDENRFTIKLYNNAGAVLAQPWNFIASGYRV